MSRRTKHFRRFMGAIAEETVDNILRSKRHAARPMDVPKANRIAARLHVTKRRSSRTRI